jgi:aminoglycoside 6'-N-acetyltransferase I
MDSFNEAKKVDNKVTGTREVIWKMNNKVNLTIDEVSEEDISRLTEMVIKLWPDCNYEEEFVNCLKIKESINQTIFIAKEEDAYAGFIQLAIRTEYVEGTITSPIVYIEGLYVEPNYRKQGIANRLVKKAEVWGLAKSCSEIASDAELNNIDSIEFHKSIGFKEINRLVCFSKTIDQSNNVE